MGERDPQTDIDVDVAALGLPPALAQLITSMQDTIQGLDQRIIELGEEQAEELPEFQTRGTRFRGGKGITLLKRGRNSFEIALTNPHNDLQIQQLLIASEEDDHLSCRTWDGRVVNVMKPFDLQRQVYQTVETNFTGSLQYEYLSVNQRRAHFASGSTDEEFQIITRSYSASPYILAASSTMLIASFSLRPQAPTRMQYEWMDLNVAGRSWAVDPDGGT